jgi:transposase
MAGKARVTRVTGEARERLVRDVVDRYQGGASIREIAGDVGRSYGFVHNILTTHGVPMRGRGGATRGRTTRLAAG